MKGKERYRKGKGIRKRKELIVTYDVTQEIRKQLNRLWNAVRKISFRAQPLTYKNKNIVMKMHFEWNIISKVLKLN